MQAALFDLDGTLLDSMPFWQQLALDYCHQNNVPADLSLTRRMESLTLIESAELLAGLYPNLGPAAAILANWRSRAEQAYATTLLLKPDAAAYLDWLARSEVRIALVTLTDRDLVEPALQRLGIRHYFACILTAAEIGCNKQDPAIWLQAARQLAIPVGDCTVYEDSLYAARTAKTAGFTVVALYDAAAENQAAAMRELCDAYYLNFSELVTASSHAADPRQTG